MEGIPFVSCTAPNFVARIPISKIEELIGKIPIKYYFDLFFIFVLIYILYSSFTPLINLLGFEKETYYYISLVIILITCMTIIFHTIYAYFDQRFKLNQFWIFYTILIMIYLLCIGACFINNEFNPQKLDLVLRDSNNINHVVGNISCSDTSGNMRVGRWVSCKIYPLINITRADAVFVLNNGTMPPFVSLDPNLGFYAPENLEKIRFYIYGVNLEGEEVSMQVSNKYHFFTDEEIKDNKNKKLSYFILLLGAVLFSVPSMMNNLKQISNK